jgi:hypothetical protein
MLRGMWCVDTLVDAIRELGWSWWQARVWDSHEMCLTWQRSTAWSFSVEGILRVPALVLQSPVVQGLRHGYQHHSKRVLSTFWLWGRGCGMGSGRCTHARAYPASTETRGVSCPRCMSGTHAEGTSALRSCYRPVFYVNTVPLLFAMCPM